LISMPKPLASALSVSSNSPHAKGRDRRRGRAPDGNDASLRRTRPMRKPAPGTELSYSVRLLRPFIRTVRSLEKFPAHLLRTMEELEPDSRIPISVAHQTLDIAVAMTGDAALGLKAARAFMVGEAGAVDYAVASAATGLEAFDAAMRFTALVNDALEIR